MAWHFLMRKRTNYYGIVDKRTPRLRGGVLGADTTGPAVARVGASEEGGGRGKVVLDLKTIRKINYCNIVTVPP